MYDWKLDLSKKKIPHTIKQVVILSRGARSTPSKPNEVSWVWQWTSPGEAPIQELWGELSNSSLPVLQGSLWAGVK